MITLMCLLACGDDTTLSDSSTATDTGTSATGDSGDSGEGTADTGSGTPGSEDTAPPTEPEPEDTGLASTGTDVVPDRLELLTDSDLVFHAPDAGEMAGRALATGDWNGDGSTDFALGAWDNEGAGAVYVAHGPLTSGGVLAADVGFGWEGVHPSLSLGTHVGDAGDVDGDGVSDLAVAAPDNRVMGQGSGSVYLLTGGADAAGLGVPTHRYHGQEGTRLGDGGVLGLGDTDGDGLVDLVIGSPRAEDDDGVLHLVTDHRPGDHPIDDRAIRLQGERSRGGLGSQVAAPGDVDGDGLADLLVTVDTGHQVALLRGPVADGMAPEDAHALFTPEDIYDFMGNALGGADDVDGDGLPDLLIGAVDYNRDDEALDHEGAVYVMSGLASGTVPLDQALGRIAGTADLAGCGVQVQGLGDTNGDGQADLAVSCNWQSSTGRYGGIVGVFRDGVQGARSIENADELWFNEDALGYAGQGLAAADLNDDGLSDLLVGDHRNSTYALDAGSVYLLLGALP